MKNLKSIETVKLIFLKSISKMFVLGVLSAIIFTSCKKDNSTVTPTTLANEVAGTYSGTLKNSATNESKPATLSVTRVNDSLVSMHCVAAGFDTTLINLCYQNDNQIMLCYSGQDFFNQYGHNMNNYNFCSSKQSGWMNNGWMNDSNCWGNDNINWGNKSWAGNDQWNAWINHLNTQHNQNDMHYGIFNMSGHNCDYTFIIKTPSANYTQQFVGAIQ